MKSNGLFKHRMRGSVAIVVGLAIVVMIAFLGIVIDLGRLYTNKTELSNAADACALAAATELTGDQNSLTYAVNAASTVTSRNYNDFQDHGVTFAASMVSFSQTLQGNYLPASSVTAANVPNMHYAQCTFQQTGIFPWFMQVMGFGAQTVAAHAVATLAPAQKICSIPIALVLDQTASGQPFAPQCTNPVSPYYNTSNFQQPTGAPSGQGYCIGQWYGGARASAGGGFNGAYNWVSFNTGSTTNQTMEDWLANGYCQATPGQPMTGQNGMVQAFADYYNSRFGIYKNGTGLTPQNVPPDFTGFAYVSGTTWIPSFNAFSGAASGVTPTPDNYKTNRDNHLPYQSSDPDNVVKGGSSFVDPLTTGTYAGIYEKKRLIYIPVIPTWSGGNNTTLMDFACALLLEPMGGPGSSTYIEFQGLASAGTTPCFAQGTTGGNSGPKVPTLVR